MAGNVNEWAHSLDKDYRLSDGREVVDVSDNLKVLRRGGGLVVLRVPQQAQPGFAYASLL